MTKKEEVITIDNVDYKLSQLSDECRQELATLQLCEQEIVRVNAQLAIALTARNAYRNAVSNLLPEDDTKH
mgnify:FL=1|jgi:hypothetical protein|tara:strand:- start:3025 stop:3237 length:213 start_codon:yes stop_codon:yes gene_type:complete